MAGRPAYELVLEPRDTGSLVGSVRIAIDGADPHPDPRAGLRAGRLEAGLRGRASRSFDPTTPGRLGVRVQPAAGHQGDPVAGAGRRRRPGPRRRLRQGRRRSATRRSSGTGWTTVVVAPAARAGALSGVRAARRPACSRALPKVSGSWGSGHLLRGHAVLGRADRRRPGRRRRGRTRRRSTPRWPGDDRRRPSPRSGSPSGSAHQVAVDALDLAVPPGSVFGFLGPQRLGEDHDHPDAARAGHADRGQRRAARPADAGRARPPCCPGSAPWSRARPSIPTSRAATTCVRLDAADRTADRRDRAGADRRGARPGRAAGRRGQALPRLLAGHAAAAGHRRRPAARRGPAGARRADQRARPAGHPRGAPPGRVARRRRARPCWSPATCCPRSSRCAPTSASCTSGSWSPRAPAPSCGPAASPRRRVETDQPEEAARIMRELGLPDVRMTVAAGASARLGAVAPEKVSPRCVHAGRRRCSASGSSRPSLEDVFVVAHRGGLRCQRLTRRVDRTAPVRGGCRTPVPALRAAADLRAPPQPGRPAGPGRRPGPHRGRGQGRPRRAAAAAARTSSGRSPSNGLFVALAALTIELGLFLPLAVAAIVGRRGRRRGQPRHAALPAHRPGPAAPAARGQVRSRS